MVYPRAHYRIRQDARVDVLALATRTKFGKVQFKVKPVTGEGEFIVEQHRLSFWGAASPACHDGEHWKSLETSHRDLGA